MQLQLARMKLQEIEKIIEAARQEFLSQEKKIYHIEEMVKIQCTDGTWNFDGYMHGMANGLIIALSALTGEEPKLLTAPKVWVSDMKAREQVLAMEAGVGKAEAQTGFTGGNENGPNGSRKGRAPSNGFEAEFLNRKVAQRREDPR